MEFGFGVFVFYAAHVVRVGCFVVNVGHTGEFKVQSLRLKVKKESRETKVDLYAVFIEPPRPV